MTGWSGGAVGDGALCVLAPNPSPMTLEGTNTWVLRAEDSDRSVVVDPGPLNAGHLAAVARAAGDVQVVLLTHHHLDHAEGARALAERAGCGVRALDPACRLGDEGLADGDVVAVGDLEVHVVGTPGHTADSLSFWVPQAAAVLTGDTVLGRGTAVVAHPDGHLGAYLDSLHNLRALASERGISSVWPGHGPVVEDALGVLDHYLAHRAERLDQVRAALRTLPTQLIGGGSSHAAAPTAPADRTAPNGPAAPSGRSASTAPADRDDTVARRVVEIVYADVDPVLWPAAELSVRAQLAYLRELR